MSFYTALSGMKAAQTMMGVISNNIANVETAGFKKSSVQFSDVLASSSSSNPRMAIGLGTSVRAISQNFAMGQLVQTGSALDLAVGGNGFFAVKAADGALSYTRAGAFSVDSGGFIQSSSGSRLQLFAAGSDPATAPLIDAQIPVVGPGGGHFAGLDIAEDGTVSASYADGSTQVIGQVAIASFTAPTELRQMGSGTWAATGLSGSATFGLPGQGGGKIFSGMLERSNVDLTDELVSLIAAQRFFQANAKAMETAMKITETIINLRT